jgi:hypothetical protein
MHKIKPPVLFAAFLFCALAAAGNALGDRDPARGGAATKTVQASGRVRLVGSSPQTSLVISGGEREWYVHPGEEKKLMHLQQQTVTVAGTEYVKDLTFANGTSAGRRYYLKNIRIISEKR